jgi:hypothetical protein
VWKAAAVTSFKVQVFSPFYTKEPEQLEKKTLLNKNQSCSEGVYAEVLYKIT